MHYLIKMCSLCLCHNKDLIKIDQVQEIYINFLKKVLLQPSDSDKMKLEDEYICKMCTDKLESCFELSKLCNKNKIYSTFCCLCLNSDRNKLANLRKISPDCASFYCKLIRSVRPQIFTCEKCLEKLNFYQQFQKSCILNNETLTGYLQQLTNFSTEKVFKNCNVTVQIETFDMKGYLLTKEKQMQEREERERERMERERERMERERERLEQERLENATDDEIMDINYIKQEDEPVHMEIEENMIYANNDISNIIEPIVECRSENDESCSENNYEDLEDQKEDDVSSLNNYEEHSNEVENYNRNGQVIYNNEEHRDFIYNGNPTFDFEGKNMPEEDENNLLLQNFSTHFLDSSENHSYQMDPSALLQIETETPTTTNLPTNNENAVPSGSGGGSGDKFVCKFCPENGDIKSFKTHKFTHIDRQKIQCLICHKKLKYYKNLVAHLRKHYKQDPRPIYDPNLGLTYENLDYVINVDDSDLETEDIDDSNTSDNSNMTSYVQNPNQNYEIVNALKNLPNIQVYSSQPAEASNEEEIYENEDVNDNMEESTTLSESSEKFVCKYCPEGRNVFDSYQTHKFEHIDRQKVQCLICFKKIKYYRNLVVHLADHFRGYNITPPFYCPYCKCSKNEKLFEHKYKHMDKSQNLCLICMKKFDNFTTLNVHIYTHYKNRQKFSNVPTFKRPVFKKMLIKPIPHKEHLQTLHVIPTFNNELASTSEMMFTCPFCPGLGVTNLKEHKFVHINITKNLCLICGRKFAAYKYLYKHIMGHYSQKTALMNHHESQNQTQTPPQVIQDENIDQEKSNFVQNLNLNSNEITLTIKKPVVKNIGSVDAFFDCRYCNKTVNETYFKHFYEHINIDNKMCYICDKNFTHIKYLYKHTKNHFSYAQIKKYRILDPTESGNLGCCPFCITPVNESLPVHRMSHVDPINNICLICYKQFGVHDNLLGHVAFHFRRFYRSYENPNANSEKGKCPFCPNTFVNDLTEHKQTHINTENNQCLICLANFESLDELKVHLDEHYEAAAPKKVLCVTCNIEVEEKVLEKHKLSKMHVFNQSNKHSQEANNTGVPGVLLEPKKSTPKSFCRVCRVRVNRKGFEKHKNTKMHLENVKTKKMNLENNIVNPQIKTVPPKAFCRYCKILVLRKGFEKHKNSKTHMDNVIRIQNEASYQNYEHPEVTDEQHLEVVLKTEPEEHDGDQVNIDMHILAKESFETEYSNSELSEKTFCNLCNVEVLTKSFPKHTISKGHIENLRANKSNKMYSDYDNANNEDAADSVNDGSKCHACGRTFANQASFIRHVTRDCKFVPARFQCDICLFKFRRRYIMINHMEKIHGVTVDKN